MTPDIRLSGVACTPGVTSSQMVHSSSENDIGYVLGVGGDAKVGDNDGRGERRELERSRILGVFGHAKCPVSASVQKKGILAFYLDTYRPVRTPLDVQGKPSFYLHAEEANC